MKYLLFASCVHVDILSQRGSNKFIEEVNEFHCMEVADESDFILALKKVERYGSFSFISKKKYDTLLPKSEE